MAFNRVFLLVIQQFDLPRQVVDVQRLPLLFPQMGGLACVHAYKLALYNMSVMVSP